MRAFPKPSLLEILQVPKSHVLAHFTEFCLLLRQTEILLGQSPDILNDKYSSTPSYQTERMAL